MRPDLPWTGRWVRVHEDRSWEWVRCVMCNQPLSDRLSTRRGVGPDCAVEHDAQEQDAARAEARRLDRFAYAKGQRWSAARGRYTWKADRPPGAGMREAHERRDEEDVDAAERWARFRRTMREAGRAS